MTDDVKLTKAQRVTLAYLTEHLDDPVAQMHDRDARWTGGSLVGLYEGRERARCAEDGRTFYHDTERTHGWRRRGGSVLSAMAKAGALHHLDFEGQERGLNYVLSRAGAQIAAEMKTADEDT